jgi:hypothetical protein
MKVKKSLHFIVDGKAVPESTLQNPCPSLAPSVTLIDLRIP